MDSVTDRPNGIPQPATAFGTIVIGHDGTAAADAALRFAEQLAGEGARLLVARVVPPRGDVDAELDRLRAGVAPGSRVETRVVEAHSPVRGLAAVARDEHADLIVVGSDRRPGDYRVHKVLGLRLLNGAPCAVAIPSGKDESEVRRIGVAYDGSAESELALEAAYALAQRLHAAVTLYLAVLPDATTGLHSQLAHREAGALLDAAADRAPEGVNPATVVITGYASRALVDEADGVVDLLVLGSRRQGPLMQAILGSTSRAVAVEVECAVLVTPRGAA